MTIILCRIPPEIKIYGDVKYRSKSCPSETLEQVTFFNVLRKKNPDLGEVAIHIRNERKRNPRTAIAQVARETAEGMVPGASDIVIPGCPAFVGELKRLDRTVSEITDEQIQYLVAAQGLGAFAVLAFGHLAMLEAVKDWGNK